MKKIFSKDGGPKDKLMMVEGNDDFNAFYHLFTSHNIMGICKVGNYEGIENIMPAIRVEIKAANHKCIGVVVDADTDISARWQSIRSAIIGSEQFSETSVPKSPSPDGTIIFQEGLPKIGIWIMPDNKLPGMLEDFARFLIPFNDKLYDVAEKAVAGIPVSDRLFNARHLTKVHLYTWLAWQANPGLPIGQAISQTYLKADAEHAVLFIDWVKKLYNSV